MLASLWTRDEPSVPEKGRARNRLISPGGKELVAVEYEIDLTEHQRRRSFGHISGFPYAGDGRYEWTTEREIAGGDGTWEEISRLPVDVAFRPLGVGAVPP
jgi:hypothetical protein